MNAIGCCAYLMLLFESLSLKGRMKVLQRQTTASRSETGIPSVCMCLHLLSRADSGRFLTIHAGVGNGIFQLSLPA